MPENANMQSMQKLRKLGKIPVYALQPQILLYICNYGVWNLQVTGLLVKGAIREVMSIMLDKRAKHVLDMSYL